MLCGVILCCVYDFQMHFLEIYFFHLLCIYFLFLISLSFNHHQQTTGFSGAKFKSFSTEEEAKSFISANSSNAVATSSSSSSSSSLVRPAKRQRVEDKEESLPPITSKLSISLHFDGGARGNPGVGGSGAIVVAKITTTAAVDNNNGKSETTTKTTKLRHYCGSYVTNNVAEYHGLLIGLKEIKICVQNFIADQREGGNSTTVASATTKGRFSVNVEIHGDSNLIINQLEGTNECKSPKLRPLFSQCKALIHNMENSVAVCRGGKRWDEWKISYGHVYREVNTIADALANEAMDQRRSWTTTTSSTDDEGEKGTKKGKIIVL